MVHWHPWIHYMFTHVGSVSNNLVSLSCSKMIQVNMHTVYIYCQANKLIHKFSKSGHHLWHHIFYYLHFAFLGFNRLNWCRKSTDLQTLHHSPFPQPYFLQVEHQLFSEHSELSSTALLLVLSVSLFNVLITTGGAVAGRLYPMSINIFIELFSLAMRMWIFNFFVSPYTCTVLHS